MDIEYFNQNNKREHLPVKDIFQKVPVIVKSICWEGSAKGTSYIVFFYGPERSCDCM